MPIEYRKFISRQMLRDEPEKLFVFGDNLRRKGFGGQAREMRGEPNAVGIPTKIAPSMHPNAFFTDRHIDAWKRESAHDIERLRKHAGKIVWPKDGIGTGLARLDIKAPGIFDAIERLRKELDSK